ncbi:hypothetical protein H4R35_006793, partial [Dimargaris xerosporica]
VRLRVGTDIVACRICGIPIPARLLADHLQAGSRCDVHQQHLAKGNHDAWIDKVPGACKAIVPAPDDNKFDVKPTRAQYQAWIHRLLPAANQPLSLSGVQQAITDHYPTVPNSQSTTLPPRSDLTALLTFVNLGSLSPKPSPHLSTLLFLFALGSTAAIFPTLWYNSINECSPSFLIQYYGILNANAIEALTFERGATDHPPIPNAAEQSTLIKRWVPLAAYTQILNWVWASILPLQLGGVLPGLANDTRLTITQRIHDRLALSLTGPTEVEQQSSLKQAIPIAKQKLAVGSVLATAMHAFIGQLIKCGVDQCRAQNPDWPVTVQKSAKSPVSEAKGSAGLSTMAIDESPDTNDGGYHLPPRSLMPMHVYRACLADRDQFDFLLHGGMGVPQPLE